MIPRGRRESQRCTPSFRLQIALLAHSASLSQKPPLGTDSFATQAPAKQALVFAVGVLCATTSLHTGTESISVLCRARAFSNGTIIIGVAGPTRRLHRYRRNAQTIGTTNSIAPTIAVCGAAGDTIIWILAEKGSFVADIVGRTTTVQPALS